MAQTEPRSSEEGQVQSGRGHLNCKVELFGLARSLAGSRDLELELPADARVGDALAALSARHPALLGRVVRADGLGLTEGHALNLNGRSFVEDVGARLEAGDTLLILSNTAGG